MHFKSLLHVRDHAKVRGTAHHMLEFIALHTNVHTGEAFELTVDRLAHRLEVTPQWVGQLRRRLVESGELIVKQSRGRHPNVYIVPYERCPACQGTNPKVELGVEIANPKVSSAQSASEPQTLTCPTPNSSAANPKLGEAFGPQLARIEAQKENVSKEKREKYVNVEIDHPNPKVTTTLTLREEDLVDELVRRFRDEKSRGAYRRIVSRLGEDIVYRLMGLTWEVRDRIAVSPGAYFVGMSKAVAKEQGIDLGFARPGAP